jgi:hypothetical protein
MKMDDRMYLTLGLIFLTAGVTALLLHWVWRQLYYQWNVYLQTRAMSIKEEMVYEEQEPVAPTPITQGKQRKFTPRSTAQRK